MKIAQNTDTNSMTDEITFNKLNNMISEASVFKSLIDAKRYCELVRKSGIKCRPKCIDRKQDYWQIDYNFNEDVIKNFTLNQGGITNRYNPVTYQLSENEDLTNLLADVRGIITKEGDLITAQPEAPQTASNNIIHLSIYNAFHASKLSVDEFYGTMGSGIFMSENMILVQRYENSRYFALSESYNKLDLKPFQENWHELEKKFKSKNQNKILFFINIKNLKYHIE